MRHTTTSLAVAGAGILVVGLVTALPEVRDAGSEVRAARLATVAVSPTAHWRAVEGLISHARTAATTTLPRGTDIPVAVSRTPTVMVSTPQAIDTANARAMNRKNTDTAALAATPTALSIPEPLLPIIGPIILFGPLILLVILACPPCALFNFVAGLIQSFLIPFAPLAAVSAATVATEEPSPTLDTSQESEPPVDVSADVTATLTATAPDHSDTASASGTENPRGSQPVATTEVRIDTRIDTEPVTPTEPVAEDEPEQRQPTDTATRTEDDAEVVDPDAEPAESATTNDPEDGATASGSLSDRTAVDGGADDSAESPSTDRDSAGDDSSGGDDGS